MPSKCFDAHFDVSLYVVKYCNTVPCFQGNGYQAVKFSMALVPAIHSGINMWSRWSEIDLVSKGRYDESWVDDDHTTVILLS